MREERDDRLAREIIALQECPHGHRKIRSLPDVPRKVFKKTEEIQPTLDLLAGDGYIRIEEPERSSVGRPADMLVVINPEAMKLERI